MEQQIEIVDCPSELWRVVCRCLEKKAEDRPTVSEVINMLTIQPKSSPTKAAETLPQSDKTNTSAFD